MPRLVSFFLKVPELRTPELNFTGPLLTVTEWGLSPAKRHLTVVPLETVTFGTPLERT